MIDGYPFPSLFPVPTGQKNAQIRGVSGTGSSLCNHGASGAADIRLAFGFGKKMIELLVGRDLTVAHRKGGNESGAVGGGAHPKDERSLGGTGF